MDYSLIHTIRQRENYYNMKLIIGLGNIGKEYEGTRHNVGFMAIDQFAEKYNAIFKEEKRFKGFIAEARINGERIILLKPTTYMNLSGESVILVMQFYKINVNDIIVLNDDLDQPVGHVRFRAKGSAGGHNGLKSIISCIGTEEFKRIRIGIDRSKVIPVVDWVLGKFSDDDNNKIRTLFDKVNNGLLIFINGDNENKIANIINS